MSRHVLHDALELRRAMLPIVHEVVKPALIAGINPLSALDIDHA